MYRFRPSRPVRLSLVIGVVSFAVGIVDAGGGGENAVVIVDPQVPESLYVGHYYATARDLPAENVLYMPAGAANFTSFLDFQRDALLGMLANRDIDDHVDFMAGKLLDLLCVEHELDTRWEERLAGQREP